MTAAGASQSVFDYLDRQPIQKPNGVLQPRELKGDIEFSNVSLTYPARPNEIAIQVSKWIHFYSKSKRKVYFRFLVKNMSFKIKSGQTCAFVGPSGSGN